MRGAEKIILYPNPAFSQLHILGFQNQETIEIYNLTGERVLKRISFGIDDLINVSGFPPGIYCVVIGGRFFQRVIKI